MNPFLSTYRAERLKARRKRRLYFLLFLVTVLITVGGWKSRDPSSVTVLDSADPPNLVVAADHGPEKVPVQEPGRCDIVTIVAGDTLGAIFESQEISHSVMYQILSADEPLLALDILRPGNRLTFTREPESGNLIGMELFIHPGHRVFYSPVDETNFEYREIIISGHWERELLEGEIEGSFYASARSAGLTDQETANVTELFRDQILFSRQMRAGDRFQVIRSRQFVDGEFTGRSRIKGVRIYRGSRLYSAFLFDDGQYYDHEGKSLLRAFRRYPMSGEHRITSHFSPARRNPVTGRVAPHNGVDFGMPTGTAVLSIGDGVITRVHNHPFAGKYIEIRHCSRYSSRYLHLSRILVRRGQTVQRGERVALSGNTGRSTAPHLHFELHVDGRPVNPLTARIPTASSVPRERRDDFSRRVEEIVALMDRPQKTVVLKSMDDRT